MPKRMEFFGPAKPPRREGRPNSYRRGYGGKAWKAARKAALIRDNFQCQSCGRVCGEGAQVDHIIPKRILDSNDLDGLQTLCPQCHARKGHQERLLASGSQSRSGRSPETPGLV
jgi:5-methylcytosine-specific restriction protein A